MNRKHSYRILGKRKHAKNILFYLQDPEDAKTIFKFTKLQKSEEKEIRHAYATAEHLIDETKAGKQVNTSIYSPLAIEIKQALKAFTQPRQTALQL